MSAASLAAMLPKALKTADQLRAALEFERARVLPLGIHALDRVLPQGGLPQGRVVELQVRGAGSVATSFALAACRGAQRRVEAGREPGMGWCAFIDPTQTLFAPGVARLGVSLERLLVARPAWSSVERVAVRIAEAKVAAVLVVDLRGPWGEHSLDQRRWSCAVRRLSLIVERLSTCVLLLTRAPSAASWALPTAMRLEIARISPGEFEMRVGKERTGRISPRHVLSASVFDSPFMSSDLVTGDETAEDALARASA